MYCISCMYVASCICSLRWLETLFEKCEKNGFEYDIIHLMYTPEGNSEFCFPESLNVSRDEVEVLLYSKERKITFTIIVFHDMTVNRKFYSINETFASSK